MKNIFKLSFGLRKTYFNLLKYLILLIILVVYVSQNFGQVKNQIVTDHFSIYFTLGAKETARRVAEVAEEVYTPLASAFNAYDDFSRIYVFVHDDRDFSNAFADYYQNKIEIWASDLDFELRGTNNWIRNVVTHELAHVVSLKVAKRGFFNLGILSLGRFNVNPDFFFTIPFYHLVVPSWFAEGIAQFEAREMGNDEWDTHRDMLLRMAVLENDLLSYEEMGVFSKDGLHSEMVYNQGFALMNYIHRVYGEDKVEGLTHNTGLLNFNKSIKKVLDIGSDDLYQNWKQSILKGYNERAVNMTKSVHFFKKSRTTIHDFDWKPYKKNRSALTPSHFTEDIIEGELVIDGGYLDYFPTLSPDGKMIAYISNEGSDFSITNLKLFDTETGKVKELVKRVRSRISWTPDGNKIVYVKRKDNFNEIFVYDMDKRQERRISANLRAKDPSVSPDGKTITFVRNKDGSSNLGLMNINGAKVRYLSNFNDGTQCYSPQWSPDGSRIAFSIFRGEDRDIAVISSDSPTFSKKVDAPDSLALADSTVFNVLINTIADERDPCWLPDGSGFVFSSDRDGIFNLYEYTLETGECRKRSEVLGGAFGPSISSDGKIIIYAGYHAANYNIYYLARETYEEPVEIYKMDRDYLSIYTGKSLEDLYTMGRASKRFSIYEAVPIISLSPNFIGNKFTINTFNAGLQLALGDIWGRDYFVGYGIIGRAIKKKLDINYTLSGYYQRRLPSILTQDRTLAPTGYGFINKRVINDYDEISDEYQETFVSDLIVYSEDFTEDTLRNVLIDVNQSIKGGDKSKFDLGLWGTGFRLPLNQWNTLNFNYMHRNYRWSIFRDVVFEDNTRFFQQGEELFFEGYPYSEEDKRFLFDTEFYSSNDIFLSWSYLKLKSTSDAIINPAGGRFIYIGCGRLSTTITDSLVYIDQQNSLPSPPYLAVRRKFPVNEFRLNWLEFISMPIHRHTLGIEALFIYRDQRIPEDEELVNIDGVFPLRLYLGGFWTLRGYPYFALSGSKLFFSRFKYTFPIFQNIGKQIFHFYFDRLYSSLFFDVGTTWNFKELSDFKPKDTEWLYDAGFELRMSLFNFYRIPATAFFTIAWPLVDLPEERVERGDHRIYFGMTLGGSY